MKVSERLRNLFVKESFANMDVVEKYSEALGCCESDSDVAAFAGMLSRAKEIDLLGSDDGGHRVRVAIQSSDPVVLAMCARDFESDIRAIAARNRRLTDGAALFDLARDEHYKVRCAVAGRDDIPFDMRVMLMGDENYMVRAAAVVVAGNENVDVATAYVIADSGSVEARRILAGNEGNGLYSGLRRIASFSDDVVARRTCAANPRATIDTLVQLVSDEDDVVRREAVANLIRRRL